MHLFFFFTKSIEPLGKGKCSVAAGDDSPVRQRFIEERQDGGVQLSVARAII